jgi:nucleoside recognition membrane protein YjiH
MNMKKLTNYLLFIIPSILGIFLFLIPIKHAGTVMVPVGILIDKTYELVADQLGYIVLGLIVISAIGSTIAVGLKPKFITHNDLLKGLFEVTTPWLFIRLMSAVFAFLVVFQVGPEFIKSGNTGGVILYDLLTVLVPVFLFAGFLTTLLLNFGLLEFIGTYLSKVMRPIFKLPGRSSVDCITSWLGDGTVGVMITNQQYTQGYYNKYEASVISTCFSFVSITFSFVVIQTVNLSEYFVPFYATVLAAGLVAAIIIPRIPPLSRKKQTFYEGTEPKVFETIPTGQTIHQYALSSALEKARGHGNLINTARVFVSSGLMTVLNLWLAVVPAVMALGTIAVVIAEYTPIFELLGYPFYPILQVFNVPQALEASKTTVIGFADMLLPTIVATSGANPITNPMTLFIVASLSVSQLVYMSEVGGVIISSKIPIKIPELFLIFILRTLVTLPVIILAAHLIF